MKTLLLTLVALIQLYSSTVIAADLIESATQHSQTEQAALINLNTATQQELMTLPGIGKSKAAAILAYREQAGEFSDINELTKVKGIGKRLMAKLATQLVVR